MRKIFIAIFTVCMGLFILSGCDLLSSFGSNSHNKVFKEMEAFFKLIETDNVTEDIDLPKTSEELPDAIISWSSNNKQVIANDGTVTRPSEDTEVTLTVSVEIEEIIKKKPFIVTVIKAAGSGGETPDKKPIFTDVVNINYIIGSSVVIDYLHEIAATDYLGNDITDEIVVDTSKVDLTKEGRYEITYSVTDSEGNSNQVKAYVNVVTAGDYDLISSIPSKALGTSVEVRGVVTGITRTDTFFIQDYTGGISIFDQDSANMGNVAVGDEVVVTGTRSRWMSSNGTDVNLESQITLTNIEQADKTYNIEAERLTSLNNNTLSSLEGSLVSIEGVNLVVDFSAPSGDLNIKITDKTNEVAFFANKNISGFSSIVAKLTGITTAYSINLTNVIISSYRGGLQILCSDANQITLKSPNPIDTSVSYVVNYYGINDQLIGTENVYKNDKIKGLTSDKTTISGYRFNGWYTEAARTNSFSVSTIVTQNYNLYGKWTEGSTSGNYTGPYYDGVDLSLTGSVLMKELYDLIKSGSTGTYSSGKSRDTVSLADTVTGKGVLLIYGRGTSQISYETGSNWNQEHVLPQAILKEAGHSSNTGDLHNLRACDYDVNSARGSLRFAAGSGLAREVSGGWYAGDEWIGDCARIILYMATRYTGFKVTDVMTESLLAKWNAQDPVSDFEINRNNVIANKQGNRNPYVDYPELVDAVLGTTEMNSRKTQNSWYECLSGIVFEQNVEYIIPSKYNYEIGA